MVPLPQLVGGIELRRLSKFDACDIHWRVSGRRGGLLKRDDIRHLHGAPVRENGSQRDQPGD
jgi:hypothetical protein